ncbi:outer membrane lipoprotein LolB [Massilia sp. KIM]|uniref:outer membrane lipoprotein LolB n=1 Tax=Massilia sp. KIM TaxID=1955422 RepID=UPI00098F68D7|nr:outer membrane lipoprotein LolB [Massilia sp. KIM]OON59823.1 outer membrane lipoprotein LolB [Massilia sp. KIM]
MPITRRLTLIALAAALAGCATTATMPSTATVGAYRESIDLSGRLSVNYLKDGARESLNGNFNWAQRPDRTDVTLNSPLGQTIATIAVTPGEATLTQSGRAPRSAADIDGLTQQTLGWTLPVAGLRDWLQGYAVDEQGRRFAASPANNSVSTKDGWRLRFMSWQDDKAPQPMPRVINAERSAVGDIQDLQIRIVIDPAA